MRLAILITLGLSSGAAPAVTLTVDGAAHSADVSVGAFVPGYGPTEKFTSDESSDTAGWTTDICAVVPQAIDPDADCSAPPEPTDTHATIQGTISLPPSGSEGAQNFTGNIQMATQTYNPGWFHPDNPYPSYAYATFESIAAFTIADSVDVQLEFDLLKECNDYYSAIVTVGIDPSDVYQRLYCDDPSGVVDIGTLAPGQYRLTIRATQDSSVSYVEFDGGSLAASFSVSLTPAINPVPAPEYLRIESPALITNREMGRYLGTISMAENWLLGAEPAADTGYVDSGEAYLFNPDSGERVHTLNNPAPEFSDHFGWKVATSDSVAAVSAYDASGGGKVHLYDTTSGAWLRTLSNPAPGAYSKFGFGLDVDDSQVLVGATGAAFLFDSSTGALLQTFANPAADNSGSVDDRFGWHVGLSSDHVLVGAQGDDATGPDSGRAYLFSAQSGALMHVFENPLPAPATEYGDQFGLSVAIDGDHVVVGSHLDRVDGVRTGRAFLFDGASGELRHELNEPEVTGLWFAQEVAISGDEILIGTGLNTGSTHLFDATTGSIKKTFPHYGATVSIAGNRQAIGEDSRVFIHNFEDIEVGIDVAPWDPDNTVYPDSDQNIPVAFLGRNTATGDATDFDPLQIDPATLRFGPAEASPNPGAQLVMDFDGDGNTDVGYPFSTQASGITCDDTEVSVSGETYGGEEFTATDTISTEDCETGGCHP